MEPVRIRINIDLLRPGGVHTVSAQKGDTARALEIHLCDSTHPYPLTPDCCAVFTAKKPDGSVICNDCEILDGAVIYRFTSQTTSCAGGVEGQIRIYGGDKSLITTAPIRIEIYDSVAEPEEAGPVKDEMRALDALVSRTTEACAAVEQKLEDGDFRGESAYETAVRLGFAGTEQQWADSLRYDHSAEFTALAEQVRQNAAAAQASEEGAAAAGSRSTAQAEAAARSAEEAAASAAAAGSSAGAAARAKKAAAGSAEGAEAAARSASDSASRAAASSGTVSASAADAARSAADALKSWQGASHEAGLAIDCRGAAAEAAGQAAMDAETAKAQAQRAAASAQTASAQGNRAVNGADRAEKAAGTAKSEADRARTEADRAASGDILKVAIKPAASGERITLHDSADWPLLGLHLYGKTRQDRVPSPDAPAPLSSAGGDGIIHETIVKPALIDRSIQLIRGSNGYLVPDPKYAGAIIESDGDDRVVIHGDYALLHGKTVQAFVCDNYPAAGVTGLQKDGRSGCRIPMEGHRYMLLSFRPAADEDFDPVINSFTVYAERSAQTLAVPVAGGLDGIPTDGDNCNYMDSSGKRWISDELDLERGVYIRRTGSVELSSEPVAWHPTGAGENGILFFEGGVNGLRNGSNVKGICERFAMLSGDGAERINYGWGQIYLLISGSRLSAPTGEGLTEWFRKNPTKVVFEAEPTEIPLPQELLDEYRKLHTNYPATAVLGDSGAGQSLTYAADPNNYLERIVRRLTALENQTVSNL